MEDILTRVLPSRVTSPSFNVTIISPSSTLLSLLLCVSLCVRMSGTVKSGGVRETVGVDGEPTDVNRRVLEYGLRKTKNPNLSVQPEWIQTSIRLMLWGGLGDTTSP